MTDPAGSPPSLLEAWPAEGLDAYDFPLPQGCIAQEPVEPRDAARLLVLDRTTGTTADATVRDLPDLLVAGDCLVVNDTRVLPARLLGRLAGGDRAAEVLVLPPGEADGEGQERDALLRPARHCPDGSVVVVGGGAARVVVLRRGEGGRARIRVEGSGGVAAVLDAHGLPPLPPYIRRPATVRDRARYQTVYAARDGAVAAPTAGLHLTHGLLADLARRGIVVATVTLHVGPGTFRPVRASRVSDHRVEAEWFHVSPPAVSSIRTARASGRRVVAVGTTTVRALESAVGADGALAPGHGWTSLTIVPGYGFRTVDALLTNFHLPRSSLLLLVAAFAGRAATLEAYGRAVAAGYRFYSYGDAMLIR